MGLVAAKGPRKKFYTRKDDEQIIALIKEGKSVTEVGQAISHSPASIQYRITKLNAQGVKSLDDIKYKQ